MLHFDSKLCNEWDLKSNITVKMERIAVSVTAPEDDNNSDILLGVYQANSSKGKYQAKQIKKVQEDFEIENNIFAVCTDTTTSNVGVHNGGIELINGYVVRKHIMWLLCHRHIYERHVSHLVQALTGKTKAPKKQLFSNFIKYWPENFQVCNEDINSLDRFNFNIFKNNSYMHQIA